MTELQTIPTAITKYGDDAEITLLINQVRRAIPSAKDLTNDEVRSLVIASKFSGLDPFAGEIYYIPRLGIQVASKVLVSDAVTAAARRGASIIVDYQQIHSGTSAGDQISLAAGDVAWECIITDSAKRQRWFNERLQLIESYKAMGYAPDEVRQLVKDDLGDRPPVITAMGVVRASENFGGPGAEQKFTRHDRAKKRATKKAINLGGYSSTTAQRNFGGVPLASDTNETIDAEYKPYSPQETTPDAKPVQPETGEIIPPPAVKPPSPMSHDAPLLPPDAGSDERVNKFVAAATTALKTSSYPAPKSALAMYGTLKDIAKAIGFTDDELKSHSPGQEPIVSAVMHSIKTLGEAILAKQA